MNLHDEGKVSSGDNMELIEKLAKSSDTSDLHRLRELVREEITVITDGIVEFFSKRQHIMGLIATSKKNSEAILQLDREYLLLEKFRSFSLLKGEDNRLIQMLVWFLTAAGKHKQQKLLNRNSVFVKEDIPLETLKQSLLALTKISSKNYQSYGDGFDATKQARDFEFEFLREIVDQLTQKKVALDLGSADGSSTRFMSDLGFEKVVGYDISPDMIDVANENNAGGNVLYENTDLFDGIPYDSESVDFVVSNFGSASEISENIIPEVDRVLKSGGVAFLSFYNKDSIMNKWWQPWQNSLEAVVNPEDDLIEVPIRDGENIKTFKIYGKEVNEEILNEMLTGTDLVVDKIYSHSMLTAMMPPMFFDDEKRKQQVLDYEKAHSRVGPYLGYYLTVVLKKA